MAIPKDSDSVENDQAYPVAEPAFRNDDPLCLRSVSSVLESSNRSSIYNAFRATSSHDDETTSGEQTGDGTLERVDYRMAANIATFHSAARAQSHPIGGSAPDAPRLDTDEIDRPPPARLMADKLRIASTGEVTAWSLPSPDDLSPFHVGKQRSKPAANSDSSHKANNTPASVVQLPPTWLSSLESPVSPILPEYPPPVRSPTPPGLPSFGTEEARTYDFRIGAQHPVPNRNESLLRRLFRGASPSPSPSQGNQQPHTRPFAEDGTRVLGSFPRRQSGHGQSVLKGTDDHPFHQANLALAQCDGGNSEGNSAAVAEASAQADDSSPSDPSSDESTSRWLERGCLVDASVQSPPAPPNTLNSTLLSAENTGKRVDSYHTCISRAPEPNARMVRPGRSILADPCSLASTQSAAATNLQGTSTPGRTSQESEAPSFWKLVIKRAKSTFCCCCGFDDVSEALSRANGLNQNTNTITQETYVTAREQRSNESQPPLSGPAIELPEQ
ncbi:uncharacterized protein BDV17DRAFT_279873 [Aspergillus undulatus]|uniref:uncharacterized protein n=1 Tax=Aspergillus undulatus TaxID=1810928 RepID=UPI003CCCBFF5